MSEIEKKFQRFPQLQKELRALARGESGLIAANASRYGYVNERKNIFAQTAFGLDVIEWLTQRWNAYPIDAHTQIATVEKFLADSTGQFYIAHGLLHLTNKGTHAYAPLARMVAAMEPATATLTAYLCVLAAAKWGVPNFPHNFAFPAETNVVESNLYQINLSILTFVEQYDLYLADAPHRAMAIQYMEKKKDLLWNEWPEDAIANEKPFSLYEFDGGTHLFLSGIPAPEPAFQTEFDEPAKQLAHLIAKKNSRGPDSASSLGPFAASGKKPGNSPAPSQKSPPREPSDEEGLVSIPIDFKAEQVDAPLESFFKDHILSDDLSEQLEKHIYGLVFRSLAPSLGLKPPEGFPHVIFSGPPGVGKTTLAKAMARALKGMGGIDPAAPIGIVSCADLVGNAVGKTEEKLSRVFEAHRGGAVVLDEVDSLIAVYSYGKNAFNSLNGRIGNMPNPPLVILTLYPHNLHEFRGQNAGLTRRFDNVYHLVPQDEATLKKIFDKSIKNINLICSLDVSAKAYAYLKRQKKAEGPAFANAGAVEGLVGKIWKNIAWRAMKENPNLRKMIQQLREGDDFDVVRADIKFVRPSDLPVFKSGWKNPLEIGNGEAEKADRPAPRPKVLNLSDYKKG